MEWYDFALYGFFAPVISALFFPSVNPLISLIAAYGVFAMGFVMRPLGAVVFGYIGDRYGRSLVLLLSTITMGISTFALGLMPTQAQAGIWSTIGLVAVRLLQGFSVGGEFSGSVTFMVETSPLHRRGLAGSWANFGSMVGTLLGSGLAALVTTWLGHGAVHDWGWRLTFVLGGVLAMVAYLYVRRLPATPHMSHHEGQHREDSPLHEALTENRRETLLAMLFTSGYGVVFYLSLVYLPTWISTVGDVASHVALQINTLGLACTLPLVLLSGWISDHLLRRRSLLLCAFASIALAAWGLFDLAATGVADLIVAQLVLASLIAVPMGAAPAMLVELFPVADRLTGYSVAFNVGLGIAGGTAPVISTWLISVTGYTLAPALYLTLAALLSTAALFFMADRSREPLR
ncbi:MAG: MFS transporter [Gammaproteobacteria bacterium]|nr:MFS transporter [Gammaproteobacteria bacterium]